MLHGVAVAGSGSVQKLTSNNSALGGLMVLMMLGSGSRRSSD